MSENSKFDFSEDEQDIDGVENNLDENKEAIKEGAKGLFSGISYYLRNLLDFRDNTDREATINAIKADIPFKGATTWILICSIMVASVGLNADSTAVVIGAMLISPLMGPILGIGMAIAVNDIDTLRKSLINLAVMVILSLLTAFLFFFLFPLREETSELFGRTSPDIRDVLIAFFGGLALIIARTKKGTIASVIFGVAIATALMPPLCTAGYGLAVIIKGGDFLGVDDPYRYFVGALNLFMINTIFIALATFIVLKLLRFPMLKYANSKKRRRISRLAAMVAVLVMIYPSITFFKVLKQTRLENSYKSFYKNEIKPISRDLWLQEDIPKYDEKIIKLYFNVEVAESTRTILKNKLISYDNINDFKLEIIDNKNRSIDQISDAYNRAIKDLDNKDNIISGLQKEIEDLKNTVSELNEELENKNNKNSIHFSSLAKDAKIRFSDLELFGYSKALQSSNFITVDTLTVIDVKWKENYSDSISEIKEKEVKAWLEEELGTENILIRRN